MKRDYVKPFMQAERFAADEYVASCAENTYRFMCDVTDGGKQGRIFRYDESGNIVREAGIQACGNAVEISLPLNSDEGLYEGFLDLNGNGRPDGNEQPVVVWITTPENGGMHATTISQSDWERAKS